MNTGNAEPKPQPEKSSSGKSSAIKPVCLTCMIVVFVLISALGVIIYPLWIQNGKSATRTWCLSNIKMLSVGMQMYANENDMMMPLRNNWKTAIEEYVKSNKAFICPTVSTDKPCYAFNTSLGAVNSSGIDTPDKTVMLFESIPGINQCGGKELLPIPLRHSGHSIAFVDGHARGVDPREIDSYIWNAKTNAK